MKLRSVEIENFRAIKQLKLSLDKSLTVFHGNNAHGKTSALAAIAVGLGRIPTLLPEVTGVSFRDSDRSQSAKYVFVTLETTDGMRWTRRKGRIRKRSANSTPYVGSRSLPEAINDIINAEEEGLAIDLPIVAFYDTDRAVFDAPQRRRGFPKEFSRYAALEGALSVRPNFRDFFKWFYAKENDELRAQRLDRDLTSTELEAVRAAITSMIPDASGPRIELGPLRFVVSLRTDSGQREDLTLDQLSGGYRIILGLAADLARRMAQGNPHRGDPLACEAIVLIDEVELHLHPAWQQRVLADLRRTFPNTQFIVSTHSPQVLTSVPPRQIVELSREDGTIVAGDTSAATYGAEAGDVLATVMGVRGRPADNAFVQILDRYMRLVGDDEGDSEQAMTLRAELEAMSPDDPALDTADVEIRRRKILRQMGTRE